jgi:guanine deaminase
MPTDHNHFMKMALELARARIHVPDGWPFGAVVVIGGKVVGIGANEVVARSDPTAHAEVLAIRDACAKRKQYQLPASTLYTSSEPCPLCLAAAMWAGITEIYYAASVEDAAAAGFSDKEFYEQIALPRQARKIRSYQLLPNEGRAVQEEFRSKSP